MGKAPDRSTKRLRRHRKKLLFALAFIATVLADIIGTAMLKGLGIHAPHSVRESSYRRADANYHHGLRANVSIDVGTWGPLQHAVYTNSIGCKDASARHIERTSTKPRILLIGDSFTEGVGYPFEETFAGHLAREFATRGIEVLNAGCSSYSPVIYRRRVRHLVEQQGIAFDHLVVCLDMSDIVNEVKHYYLDEGGNVQRRTRGADGAFKRFIAEHTILMNALRTGIRNLRGKTRTNTASALGHERSSWTTDESLMERFGRPGLALADEHLSALNEFVTTRGVRMSLVVYPWPDQVVNREHNCVQVSYWRDWCAARSVQFIDLFPPFLSAGEPTQVVNKYFIENDVHWNAAGHVLVADELMRHLTPEVRGRGAIQPTRPR